MQPSTRNILLSTGFSLVFSLGAYGFSKLRKSSYYKFVSPKALKLGLFSYGTVISPCFYVGVKLDLYNKIYDFGPITSENLAKKENLQPRFLFEWLSQQAAQGVLTYNEKNESFSIGKTWKDILTSEEFVGLLLCGPKMVERISNVADILENHTLGRKYEDSEINTFVKTMQENTYQNVLVQHVLSHKDIKLNYETLISILSEGGLRVLDVGCGSGSALIQMAKSFPKNTFVGYDISIDAIQSARKNQEKYAEASAADIFFTNSQEDLTEKFDFVLVFDVIHDCAHPVDVLKFIKKQVKDDFVFICVDISVPTKYSNRLKAPLANMTYAVSLAVCLQSAMSEPNSIGLGTLGLDKNTFHKLLIEAGFQGLTRITVPKLKRQAVYLIQ
eukprot:snap_masked-scaffold_26-processed-gene-1.13-mRNA-1 protein AED:1.00 eAED:1.00 QI:0/-1/0/0/-1/1/1/0/386